MARQGISVQRRALNADSGTCGSGPDGKGCVLNGNPCMSTSGGDAGGDCGRAAGRAGLVGFPRPEDEAGRSGRECRPVRYTMPSPPEWYLWSRTTSK